MIDDILVIGYGNTLRTDDGLGRHAAERLAADPRLDGVKVIECHQLTPELALDVGHAALAVFVDASHGTPAGAIRIETMEPTGRNGMRWSHHLSPSSLVDLAGELYGAAPDVVVISVGVESVLDGDRMSPVVQAALPRLVDVVAELIADHVARRGTEPVAAHRYA